MSDAFRRLDKELKKIMSAFGFSNRFQKKITTTNLIKQAQFIN